MADEQPNSQPSQLDEEDLNKLEEAVSDNNSCRSSSRQSGEVNALVCRGQAKLARPFRQLCQTVNSQIVQSTLTMTSRIP